MRDPTESHRFRGDGTVRTRGNVSVCPNAESSSVHAFARAGAGALRFVVRYVCPFSVLRLCAASIEEYLFPSPGYLK